MSAHIPYCKIQTKRIFAVQGSLVASVKMVGGLRLDVAYSQKEKTGEAALYLDGEPICAYTLGMHQSGWKIADFDFDYPGFCATGHLGVLLLDRDSSYLAQELYELNEGVPQTN